jgi:hypothetical protein
MAGFVRFRNRRTVQLQVQVSDTTMLKKQLLLVTLYSYKEASTFILTPLIENLQL